MGSWKAPEGPRRRDATRYPLVAPLRTRCMSWPKAVRLFLSDVSQNGVFIATTQSAQVGEDLDLEISLPDGNLLKMRGKVVVCLDTERAARMGRPPGVGLRLAPLPAEERLRFEALVEQASGGAPTPHLEAPSGEIAPTPPRIMPRGTAPPGLDVVPSPPCLVAIDFGTTYTSVSTMVGRRVSVLPWPDGSPSFPSVVHFASRTEVVLGRRARERLATHPRLTIASPKRILGRRVDEREIAAFLSRTAYATSPGPDGMVVVDMWNDPYTIVQICAYILAEAKTTAEAALHRAIDGAVLTVPVSFDERRIDLLRRAARMAGIDVRAVIDEPSAAALANRNMSGFHGKVGVYDFGGGTFDFSIVDVSRGDFRVLGTAGDTWLGGDDFDEAIANAVADEYWRRYGIEVRHHAYEWQRLLFGCEMVKRALSVHERAVLTVPELVKLANLRADLDFVVDRRLVEQACAGPIRRSLDTCDQALELVGLRPKDLSAIYLSGGTTYIPAVRLALHRHFGVPVRSGVPVEYAVCLGAGVQAAQLALLGRNTLGTLLDPHVFP